MMTTDQLDILIERYFDGNTSITEEKLLKKELAEPCHTSQLANEARAVIGYSIATSKTIKHPRLRTVSIAASIALIFTTSLYFTLTHNTHPDSDNDCIAYVNGERITNADIVLELMQNGLDQLVNASSETNNLTANGLNDIATAMSQFQL